MATTKQVDFINRLNAERGLPAMPSAALAALPVGEASDTIGRLLKMPKAGVHAAAAAVAVPDGYYAVEYAGVLRFYNVKHGKKGGRWEKSQFVNRYASDNELRPNQAEVAAVRMTISDDVEAARQRFASKLRRCYACGKKLTDEESRRLGIGPDCGGRR